MCRRVPPFAALLLVLGCSACDQSGTVGSAGPVDGSIVDTSLTDVEPATDGSPEGGSDAGGPVITAISILPNPNSVLSATLTFTTDRPAIGQAHIANTGAPDNTLDSPPETAMTTRHSVNLLGMRATSMFTITATATDAQGHASSAPTSFSTADLPSWVPPITIVMNDKTQTSPGYTLINLLQFTSGPVAATNGVGSALVALDSDFQVVWYLPNTQTDAEKIPSGDLVFPSGGWGKADMMGNQVFYSAYAAGVANLSHALQPESNGNALSIASTLQYIPGYPAADGGTQTYAVVGDDLVEVPLDGGRVTVLADTFDFFDPHREGQVGNFNSGYWNSLYPDAGATRDWIHGNAIAVDPSDNNLVSSSTTQNWIYKVTRQGQLVWTLGYEGSFSLTNPDTMPPEAAWEYGQHGSYITPSGTVMAFDCGAARPFLDGCTSTDAGLEPCFFSRAVEFSLNTSSMTATIVWTYGSPTYTDPSNIYSNIYGSAYLLPGQGGQQTVLVDDGCEMADRGQSVGDPQNLKWARVIEVTHATPAVKVAEFDIKVPLNGYAPDPTFSGFSIYRAYRLPSLYAGSIGSQDNGDP